MHEFEILRAAYRASRRAGGARLLHIFICSAIRYVPLFPFFPSLKTKEALCVLGLLLIIAGSYRLRRHNVKAADALRITKNGGCFHRLALHWSEP